MAPPDARLNAVIAALTKVREHVEKLDETEDVDVSAYNRWIGMLDGVVDGDWGSLELEAGFLPASELLMHLDAAVAFLEGHRSA